MQVRKENMNSDSKNTNPSDNQAKKKDKKQSKVIRIDKQMEEHDQHYWNSLHKMLVHFINELEASKVEIAAGLEINRPAVINFINNFEENPKERINITRISLLTLYKHLTNPKNPNRLSNEAREKREELKKRGPNELLSAAGFAVDSSLESQARTNEDLFLKKIINEIINNLSLKPIEDPLIKTELLTQISQEISKAVEKEMNIKQTSILQVSNSENVENIIKEWMKNNHLTSIETEVENKFIKECKNLVSKGKKTFYNKELYNLYTTIINNQDQELIIKITSSESHILSFSLRSLLGQINNPKINLDKTLENIEKQSDKYLGQDFTSVPILNTHIELTCDEYFGKNAIIKLIFNSSQPQLENKVSALLQRLGCFSELKLFNCSIESLGNNSHILAKIIMDFIEVNTKTIYRSVWVSDDINLAMIQAVSNMIANWISEKFPQENEKQDFYTLCKELNNIQYQIFQAIKLFDRYIVVINKKHDKYDIFQLPKEIIDNLNKLKQIYSNKNRKIFDLHKKLLTKSLSTSELIIIFGSLFIGDLKNVNHYLGKLSENFNEQEEAIQVLHTSGAIMKSFLEGDENFLINKEWRERLNTHMDILKKYINNGKPENENIDGFLDITKYRSASEIFGNVGTIEFYLYLFNVNSDIKEIKDAEQFIINRFLSAAYYASKIDQKQRSSHWLILASRTYHLLYERRQEQELQDKAELLLQLANKLLDADNETNVKYSEEYKNSIRAEIKLAEGENQLINNKYEDALKCFFESLKWAIHIGFALLVFDNLYKIYKTAEKNNNINLKETYKEIFKDKSFLENEANRWNNNELLKKVITFMLKTFHPDNGKNSDGHNSNTNNIDLGSFKFQCQSIWNYWFKSQLPASGNDAHIIAKAIENEFIQ